jgi:hypothetical protein
VSDVVVVDDAGAALAEAGEFLRFDPVQRNLVLTLLDAVLRTRVRAVCVGARAR